MYIKKYLNQKQLIVLHSRIFQVCSYAKILQIKIVFIGSIDSLNYSYEFYLSHLYIFGKFIVSKFLTNGSLTFLIENYVNDCYYNERRVGVIRFINLITAVKKHFQLPQLISADQRRPVAIRSLTQHATLLYLHYKII